MMRFLLTLALAAPALGANPLESEHAAALADARKLGPAAVGVRYLTIYNVPEARRIELRQVIDFATNSLSREAEIVRTQLVAPTLLRLNIFNYGYDPKVWDKLATVDPFFHVQLKIVKGAIAQHYFSAQTGSKAGWYAAQAQSDVTVAAIAPWLPAADAAELVALTQTAAPILRADWWFSQVFIQAGRKGTGYYDFLGVKSRDDFDKLIGFNRKESQRVKKETAAIVARSGVSNFPRQVFAEQAVTGPRFETRDVLDDNKDARNPLRQLDDAFRHQAEETYGHLSNGLYAFHLSDDKGVQQETAPDKIGSDKTAPGNDGRIHVGVSCCRCHVEGLRAIRDWGRQVFSGPLKLSSPDPEKLRRLQQLYLGELQEKVDDSIRVYVRVLSRTNGLTPEANAKAVGRAWESYIERDVLPKDVAAEFGMEEKAYLTILRAAFKANPLADPVLAAHLANPPVAIRQDDWEQLMPLVGPTILGVGDKK